MSLAKAEESMMDESDSFGQMSKGLKQVRWCFILFKHTYIHSKFGVNSWCQSRFKLWNTRIWVLPGVWFYMVLSGRRFLSRNIVFGLVHLA